MLQEDRGKLSDDILNLKRAIDSLKEELEAIDSYNQRAAVCTNENLKKILMHNRDEEKEHAAMLTEWIRQNDAEFGKEFGEYMGLKEGDIAAAEENK